MYKCTSSIFHAQTIVVRNSSHENFLLLECSRIFETVKSRNVQMERARRYRKRAPRAHDIALFPIEAPLKTNLHKRFGSKVVLLWSCIGIQRGEDAKPKAHKSVSRGGKRGVHLAWPTQSAAMWLSPRLARRLSLVIIIIIQNSAKENNFLLSCI